MNNTITLTIPGEPVGKGRPRFNTKSGRTYTPEKTASYENLVKLTYMQKQGRPQPLTGQLRAEIKAYMKMPKSKPKKVLEAMRVNEQRPTKKPDADNIVKAILDALNGLAYEDDKQVVDCRVQKFYSDEPRVEVRICEIEPVATTPNLGRIAGEIAGDLARRGR